MALVAVKLILLLRAPLLDLADLAILKGQPPGLDAKLVMAFSGEPEDLTVELTVETEVALIFNAHCQSLSVSNVPGQRKNACWNGFSSQEITVLAY